MKHFFVLLAGLSTFACATISNGPRQTLLVESDPAGAEVIVRCGTAALSKATTPARITVLRKVDPCILKFQRDGYTEKEISLERRFHFTYWADLVPLAVAPLAFYAGTGERAALALGAMILPLLVDWKTGARYSYPQNIRVSLDPEAKDEKPAP